MMADDATELRPMAEVCAYTVVGELMTELKTPLADGWWLVQVLPQPTGSFVAIMQRRKLAVTVATDVDRVMALVRP